MAQEKGEQDLILDQEVPVLRKIFKERESMQDLIKKGEQ